LWSECLSFFLILNSARTSTAGGGVTVQRSWVAQKTWPHARHGRRFGNINNSGVAKVITIVAQLAVL
jgi:hypothetical protein